MVLESSNCPIEGLRIIKPKIFHDERGYFFESYSSQVYSEAGIADHFVQDNQSHSKKGVLRGLHFQSPPFAQAKLVQVTSGVVFDVAVDLRRDSDTFGQYYGLELSEFNHLQFYIPPGFAHGYLALSEVAIFQYKCSEYYQPSAEGGIRFDDPDLNIQWPMEENSLEVSPKDLKLSTLEDYKKRHVFV